MIFLHSCDEVAYLVNSEFLISKIKEIRKQILKLGCKSKLPDTFYFDENKLEFYLSISIPSETEKSTKSIKPRKISVSRVRKTKTSKPFLQSFKKAK